MANTEVVLRDEMGLRVPSIPNVEIVSGNTVTFTVEEGADSALYFSPETAPILSPQPGVRVELGYCQTLSYTFTSPGSGSYGVITQAPEDPAPERFHFGKPEDPPVLVIQPGPGTNYGGPTNDPQG